MIDTIVLTIPKDMFSITKPELFDPQASWALAAYPPPRVKSHQNPTKKELKSGHYKPRLTLFFRVNNFGRAELFLRVEVSLPKLHFGNNFAELQYKDFAAVAGKLTLILETMGITIRQENLAQAPISVVHYCKNIALTDGSTPYHYINKIREANVKRSLDTNRTDFRNEGHSYKWHCNAYEIVFYDKIRDLEKAKISNKRALEKDNELQLDLYQVLKKRTKKFEILRMEVRLNTRKKIKQLFGKLGISADLTFKKLFKPAISKKILLHYLDEIESKRPPLLDYRMRSDEALLADLIINNPEMSVRQIAQIYGLKKMFELVSPRALNAMFAQRQPWSWARLMKEANKVKLPELNNALRQVRDEIERFKPVKMPKL